MLVRKDHIVIRRPGVDLLALAALMMSRIDRPQRHLAFVALVPLIVLAASRREVDRVGDESLRIRHISGDDVMLGALAAICLPQPPQFLGRTRQMRVPAFRQDDLQAGLGTRSPCAEQTECHQQEDRVDSES